MRRIFLFCVCVLMAFCAATSPARAGGPDEADYPLRVHIMKFTSQPRPPRQSLRSEGTQPYVDGMGVADLFEGGQPQGFSFSFSCIGGIKPSAAFSNFPARWKKQQRILEVLTPETGQPWNMVACELKAEMRPGGVFYWKEGKIAEEPAPALKAWMVRHKYDPEQSSEDPVMAPGEQPDDPDSPLYSPE